jgi:GTP-binding protein Era
MESILKAAAAFVDAGVFSGVRFSTRPDCLGKEVCAILSQYPVKTVELGVQSMSDRVLSASRRGYKAETVLDAARRVRECGWDLGIQLMAGLPLDTSEVFLDSVKATIAIAPDFVRIYPVLVLSGTRLADSYAAGAYLPWSLENAVAWVAEAYDMFLDAGIPVIRMGLHADSSLESPGVVVAGPHHPAFGQLVRCRWWRDRVDGKLAELSGISRRCFVLNVALNLVSDVVGPARCNIEHWKSKWNLTDFLVVARDVLKGTEMLLSTTQPIMEAFCMTKGKELSKPYRSGYVAIVGAPNVGKSTLLNTLLKQKISITAPKPQTTRNRILGIITGGDHQIILVDTPGIHRVTDEFNRGLVDTALSTLNEADGVCFMIEPDRAGRRTEEFILENLRGMHTPAILVINKVDAVRNKVDLLPLIESYRERMNFHAVVPISALTGDGVPELLGEIVSVLPEGPQFYPEEYVTDQPERFFVGELVREKIFHLTQEEIPYSVAVNVDKFTDIPERDRVEIDATIHVERDSQKAIIIGKGGQMLKEIGTQARKEIEVFLGCHVFLNLFVRVQKNWRKDPRALLEFGYRTGD